MGKYFLGPKSGGKVEKREKNYRLRMFVTRDKALNQIFIGTIIYFWKAYNPSYNEK